jgi:hypothetical protein
MALKIPNTLSNLIFSDSQSASLVQQSLTSSVQPLLNFINQYFTTSGSGSSVLLTLNQALTLTKQLLLTTGTITSPSMAFAQNNTLGVFYDQANQRMGLCINNTLVGFISSAGMSSQAPSAAGNSFNFCNSSGTVLATVNNAGTFTSYAPAGTPNFVSQNGFRNLVPIGTLTNVTLPASTSSPMQTASPNGLACFVNVPFAGSIVGYSYVTTSPNAGVAGYVGRNGTIIWNCQTQTGAGTTLGATGTAAKGAYTFGANDSLYFYARSSSTSTAASAYVQAYITIEMGG